MSFGSETFQFLSAEFDVTAAKSLVAGRIIKQVDVSSWRPFLRFPGDKASYTIIIDVDPEHARGTDLTKPILIARLTRVSYLPIDGWHRIYRIFNKGQSVLPARFLTVSETNRIRLR